MAENGGAPDAVAPDADAVTPDADAVAPDAVTPTAVARFSLTVWTYRMGEAVSLMIHLGDRLGLYRAMNGSGPLTSLELAERTGLDERLLREWLYGQAAADLVAFHPEGDRFELDAVRAAVLADEESSTAFACASFRGGIEPATIDAVAESFRTGRGITYEQQGDRATADLARMTGQSHRLTLVDQVLSRLDGVGRRLDDGGLVVDVGCGAGAALAQVAAAYPQARCRGYDPSPSAIALARRRAHEAGLNNLTFVEAGAEELPAGLDADLVMTLDVLHDLPRPDRAAAAVRSAMADDGVWLIKEIRATGEFTSDRRNPLLALFYGYSLFSCLQSALSEPDGMGLGTLGLHPERLRRLVSEAGFGSVTVHDVDEPANLYYEVRASG